MADFRIVDHEDMDLSAAMLVIGFPGTGFVGSIATGFLVDAFKLDHVASVMSDDFPPMAVVRDGLALSPMRIYAAPMVCGLDGKCSQLAVLAAEVTPKPADAYALARALLEWAARKKVREVVCVDGLQIEGGTAADLGIYGVAGGPAAKKRVEALKVKTLAEGVVSGFAGALLQLGDPLHVDVLCVLAAMGEGQDAEAAAKAVELLQPLVPQLTIDPEPLRRQAAAMDAQLRKMAQRQQQTISAMSEQSEYMYG